MLKILKYQDLHTEPRLRDSMFRDRAAQFVQRLGWDIHLTKDGLEVDAYDDEEALYLVAHDAFGCHLASMRLRSMVGRTLLGDVFPGFMHHVIIAEDFWESTRFCVAPQGGAQGAARVLLAGQMLGLAQGLSGAWGIYDAKMTRVYRRLGWSPEPFAEADDPSGRIRLGCWRFSHASADKLHAVAGLGPRLSKFWMDRALAHVPIFTPSSSAARQGQLIKDPDAVFRRSGNGL